MIGATFRLGSRRIDSSTAAVALSLRRLPTVPAWQAQPRNDDLGLSSGWHIPRLADDTTPGELIQVDAT